MSEEMPQAYINGQVAEGLDASHQATVAAAIMAQEDILSSQSRFAQTPEQTTQNDLQTNQSLSKFMTGVTQTVNDASLTRNQRQRSGLYSDSPMVELLQEVLELVEDLSYASARRSAAKSNKSSFTVSRNMSNQSTGKRRVKSNRDEMTTTSKYALSSSSTTGKAQRKKTDLEIARLKELKTLHGAIKHALRNKYTISEEQVDKIKKGVIVMRNDIHRELATGQSDLKLESKGITASM